jgi:hypothetical protein
MNYYFPTEDRTLHGWNCVRTKYAGALALGACECNRIWKPGLIDLTHSQWMT